MCAICSLKERVNNSKQECCLTSTPHSSHSSLRNRALLPHTLTRGLYVSHCLHNPFSLPAPTSATTFRGVQAIFRAKPFPVLYPTFSTAVTHHTYSPMKMEQTECSETLAFKLHTPVNRPEKKYMTFRTRRKFEIKKILLFRNSLVGRFYAKGVQIIPVRHHIYKLPITEPT
jgi:hypothetical protein